MTSTSAEEEYWVDFIELYRQHSLWKIKSKGYSHKGKRNDAYDISMAPIANSDVL